MANNKSNSTMAKLLLQNKPPQNHQLSALSSSAATLRLVATPASSSHSSTTGSSSQALKQEVTVVPVGATRQQVVSSPPPLSTQPTMVRFTEQELAEMSLKELNHYLRGLSKEDAAEVKRMRRAAKNKSYAVIQREKRQDDVQRLSAKKAVLAEEISAAKFRKTRVADELNRARKEANSLMALAKRLKVQVPPHVYELRSKSSASDDNPQ